jgi:phage-related protein
VKPLFWISSSKDDLRSFPEDVQHMMGFALYEAQLSGKHVAAKPLKGFGGAGVLEIVEDYDGNTFRAVYTVKYAGAVYMLDAFQKKSKKGARTPQRDLSRLNRRLKAAEEHYTKLQLSRRPEEDEQ